MSLPFLKLRIDNSAPPTDSFFIIQKPGAPKEDAADRLNRIREWCACSSGGFVPVGITAMGRPFERVPVDEFFLVDSEATERNGGVRTYERKYGKDLISDLRIQREAEAQGRAASDFNQLIRIILCSTLEITLKRYRRYAKEYAAAEAEKKDVEKQLGINPAAKESKTREMLYDAPDSAKDIYYEVKQRIPLLDKPRRAAARRLIGIAYFLANNDALSPEEFMFWLSTQYGSEWQESDEKYFRLVLAASRTTNPPSRDGPASAGQYGSNYGYDDAGRSDDEESEEEDGEEGSASVGPARQESTPAFGSLGRRSVLDPRQPFGASRHALGGSGTFAAAAFVASPSPVGGGLFTSMRKARQGFADGNDGGVGSLFDGSYRPGFSTSTNTGSRQRDDPIARYNPVQQLNDIAVAIGNLIDNYAGNLRLKDTIYGDLIRYFADGGKSFDVFRNYVFMGPSGVGKTMHARLMGEIYRSTGIYMVGNVKETSAPDFIGHYMGQTGPKTRQVLNSNFENIVVIDEAYAITDLGASPDGGDYGKECITELVYFMDRFKGCMMIIIAGYEDKMLTNKNSFLNNNEGLSRRFEYKIVFQQYEPNEMMKILKGMLQERKIAKLWHPELFRTIEVEKIKNLQRRNKTSDVVTQFEPSFALLILNCREAHEANALNPIQNRQCGLGTELQSTDYRRVWGLMAMLYEELFSKQGGSMLNLASQMDTYCSLPSKRDRSGGLQTRHDLLPAQKPFGDDALTEVFAAMLPSKYESALADETSYLRHAIRLGLISHFEQWRWPCTA